jgi:hypothetical protein
LARLIIIEDQRASWKRDPSIMVAKGCSFIAAAHKNHILRRGVKWLMAWFLRELRIRVVAYESTFEITFGYTAAARSKLNVMMRR